MQGRNLEIGRCWRRSLSKQGQDSASELTKDAHSSSVRFFHIGSDVAGTCVRLVMPQVCVADTTQPQDAFDLQTLVACQEEDEASTVTGAFAPRSA